AWGTFHPQTTVMALDGAFADRQSNPGSGILIPCVQATKGLKNFFLVFSINANSVVFYTEDNFILSCFNSEMNDRLGSVSDKLKRIANQILIQLRQQAAITPHTRKTITQDLRAALFRRCRQCL